MACGPGGGKIVGDWNHVRSCENHLPSVVVRNSCHASGPRFLARKGKLARGASERVHSVYHRALSGTFSTAICPSQSIQCRVFS